MSLPTVRAWLTRLYTLAWRNRYGDEFDTLLEECLHSPMDVVDVIFGAFDAHLQLINGENVNWRLMDMQNKLRTTILLVFASYIGFIIAGMSLVGILEDGPMIPLVETNPAPTLAMAVIRIAAVFAFLAVVTGGIPLAVSVIRRALTPIRVIMLPVNHSTFFVR